MFRHYLNTAFRYVIRNKGLTAINILGMATGICVFILIMHYVESELSYDEFLSNKETVGRLEFLDPEEESAWTTSAMAPDLVEAVPEATAFVRFKFWGERYLEYNEIKYKIPFLALADSNVFDLFDLELIRGNPSTALSKPMTAVLTKSLASRIFSGEDPMGKIMRTPSGTDVVITGVLMNPPPFHLQFDMLMSFVSLGAFNGEEHLHNYKTYQFNSYIETSEKADPDSINKKVDAFFHEKFREMYGETDEDEGEWKAFIRPVKDIYFAQNVNDVGTRHGNRQFVYMFVIIAVFILLIACINFINISTARASARAMEVGIRKVAGCGKNRLVAQFLSESLMITLIAALLGLFMVEATFPAFESIVGIDLRIAYLENPANFLLILAGIFTLSILAGIYPAFYLTGFRPVAVLKGDLTSGRSARTMRQILIIFQFTISVVLMIGTFVVYRQLHYLRNTNLGFNKEFIVTISLNSDINRERKVFRENLLKYPEIEKVSYSYTVPGIGGDNYESFTLDGKEVSPVVYTIDPDYLDLMGMKLVEGRNFSLALASDKLNTCLINETLADKLDMDSLVGKKFDHPSWYVTAVPVKQIEIIGMLKDFHFKSLRQEIEPLMFVWGEGWANFINIRISPVNIKKALASIEKEWKAICPGYPFEYSFMDENFDRMYRSDQRLGEIFLYFAILAIFIAILGLIGLSAYTAEQRAREIGIRKAMGASLSGISVLLVREYTWLILVSSAGAWTLAWIWARNWLHEFAYRMNLDVWIFIIATLLALVVAWVTVISQTLKLAGTNPSVTLRHE